MICELSKIYNIFKKSKGISTDTRNLKSGEIFIALKGEKFDGNLFVEQALKGKALKVVSSDEKYINHPDVIYVQDTLNLLQDLANYHRGKFDVPVIAITGTNGKTTTKELICCILREKFNVLCTEGNFNNHIGVPLTVLKLNNHHQLAVIEMGASAVGEIMALCGIAMPTHGLITGIGKAHLEGFRTFDNIIKTKLELYDYLTQTAGVFFFNENISELIGFVDKNNQNVLSFEASNLRGKNISKVLIENNFPFLKLKIVNIGGKEIEISTNLYGEYNYMNIVNAIKISGYFEVDISSIKKAVSEYSPKNNRSEVIKTNEGFIILDAYNANPTSMEKSINSFQNIQADLNKYLVLGDMLELGDISLEEHIKIINRLSKEGFYKKIFFIGDEFLKAGEILKLESPKITYFTNVLEAKKEFNQIKTKNNLILIKASRGIQAEKILGK